MPSITPAAPDVSIPHAVRSCATTVEERTSYDESLDEESDQQPVRVPSPEEIGNEITTLLADIRSAQSGQVTPTTTSVPLADDTRGELKNPPNAARFVRSQEANPKNIGSFFSRASEMTPEEKKARIAEKYDAYQAEIHREFTPEQLKDIATALEMVLSAKRHLKGRARHNKYNEALQYWFRGLGHTGEAKLKAEECCRKAGTIYPLRTVATILTSAIPGLTELGHAGAAVTCAAGLIGFAATPLVNGVVTMPILAICDFLQGQGSMPVLHSSIENGDTYRQIRDAIKENSDALTTAMKEFESKETDASADQRSTLSLLIENAEKNRRRHHHAVAMGQQQWKANQLQCVARTVKVTASTAIVVAGIPSAAVTLAAGVATACVCTAASMAASRFDRVAKMKFVHRINMKYAIPYLLKQFAHPTPEKIESNNIDVKVLRDLIRGPGVATYKFVEAIVQHNVDAWDEKFRKLDAQLVRLQARIDMQPLNARRFSREIEAKTRELEALVNQTKELEEDFEKFKNEDWANVKAGGIIESLLVSDSNMLYRDIIRRYRDFDQFAPELAQHVGLYFNAICSYLEPTAAAYVGPVVHEALHTVPTTGEQVGATGVGLGLGLVGSGAYQSISTERYRQKAENANEKANNATNQNEQCPAAGSRNVVRGGASKSAKMFFSMTGNAMVAAVKEPYYATQMSLEFHNNKKTVARAAELLAEQSKASIVSETAQ